jgi:tetratricopeptide (TPR) repeat protein
MSYIKKRVPRKPGPTPQEILADEKSLANWFSRNKNLVVYGSGAAVLILLLFLGTTWTKNQKRDNANAALSNAMAMYQATVAQMPEETENYDEKLSTALESLDNVISDFSGTPQGQAAALFKANVLFRLGRYEEAATTVENLIKEHAKAARTVNAYYLLARSYEATDDYAPAIKAYEASREMAEGTLVAVIDIDLARCHELAGEKEAAIAIYEQVLSEFPDTVFSNRADKKLAILGVTDQETL